jgi:hypothetical protein
MKYSVLLAALTLFTSLGLSGEAAAEVVVPVKVVASSNVGNGGDTPFWHVNSLLQGAKHFDPATGSNAPYGLFGSSGCSTNRPDDSTGLSSFPGHEWYRGEPAEHPKPQGMWLSEEGDHEEAWLEFELPEVTPLGQVWIWNWNDGPEIGRRVRHVTLQTSTVTTTAGQLGEVDFDVTRETLTFPDLGQMQGRKPDLIFKFPADSRSRYLRLHGMDNFGGEVQLGLAEVLIFAAGNEQGPEHTAHRARQGDHRLFEFEPHWHLFLDDHSITRSTGFQRVVHHPKPRGIVLKGDKPWETRGVTPLFVGPRQSGGFECYYRAHGPQGSFDAYAISEDGRQWEKPNLGLVSYDGSQENNLSPIGQPRDLFAHGNIRNPEKRFTLHYRGNPAPVLFAAEPPDLLNDPDWKAKLVNSGGFQPSHWNTLEFWDDIHNEWVAMRQAPNHPPVRCGGRYASADLTNWNLEHFLYPDAHDSSDPRSFDEVYGIMSIHVEGLALGYAYWFHGDRTHPNPNLYGDGHNRPTTDEGLIGKSVSKGTMDVRLVTSRDGGQTWDRTISREAWIPHGTEQDSYDRLVRIDCPPLRMGEEDWFYCSGYDADHSAGNGYYHDRSNTEVTGTLYTQKHNRYVSLTAGNVPQILITKPIKVTGQTLQLNVDASRGNVQVGIGIDKLIAHQNGAWKFKAILPHWMVEDRWEQTHLEDGFHFDDCLPIRDNCIEREVQFANSKLESLLGETVRLYIRVQDADLYGFRFK